MIIAFFLHAFLINYLLMFLISFISEHIIQILDTKRSS